MLQRIQTVYLFMAVLFNAGFIFIFKLWKEQSGVVVYIEDLYVPLVITLISALLSFVTIFLYKNRKLQFVLARLNMILNLILLGLFVYWSLIISGEVLASEKGIGMLTPVFSIVFLVLASRSIKKDEDLVKSVDRLR